MCLNERYLHKSSGLSITIALYKLNLNLKNLRLLLPAAFNYKNVQGIKI